MKAFSETAARTLVNHDTQSVSSLLATRRHDVHTHYKHGVRGTQGAHLDQATGAARTAQTHLGHRLHSVTARQHVVYGDRADHPGLPEIHRCICG